jgi:hypothetical protein
MLLKLYFFECWQVNWELGEQILMPLLFQDPSVNICIGSQSNDIVNALCYILRCERHTFSITKCLIEIMYF